MNCPNCGYPNLVTNVCPNCGVDTVIFKKTYKMSCDLYNRALSQAKINDLTACIDSLNKSIEFNKNNCDARNLLGLAYFEVGHIGDALKQWVISSSLKKDKNLAVSYLAKVQKHTRLVERYSDATKMYNNALSYVNQKNDDLAIIQLKKALEINPKLIDANNLLAFCCLIQKNKEDAKKLIDKVLSIDANNPIALNYYKEIFPNKTRPELKHNVKNIGSVGSTSNPYYSSGKTKKNVGESLHLAEMLSFLIGSACTFAILYILVIPNSISEKSKEVDKITLERDTIQSKYDTYFAESDSKIKELEEQNKSILAINENLNNEASARSNDEKLAEANIAQGNRDYLKSAEIIQSIDIDILSEEGKILYKTIKDFVYPQAAKLYHDAAIAKFSSSEFEEAKELFLKSSKVAAEDNLIESIYYYLAIVYQQNGDLDSARIYYDKVLDEFPRGTFRNRARSNLNNLS